MSTPAQGAVGAETKTAGQPVIRKAVFEIASRRIKSGAPGLAPATAEAIARIIGLEAASALVAVRADSDEGTAGEDGGLNDAISEIVRRAEKDQAFLRRTLARMREEATPAPATPPGVLDSVRALRKRREKVAAIINPDAYHLRSSFEGMAPGHTWDRALTAADKIIALISAHPAGQSTGLGADRADEIVTALYRLFKDWSRRGFGPDDVTWCEVKAAIIRLLAMPVPDSTRTGPVGTGMPYEARRLLHKARGFISALRGTDYPLFKEIDAAIGAFNENEAGSPAVPEAQGAEARPLSRDEARTIYSCLTQPAPPSSGQGGR